MGGRDTYELDLSERSYKQAVLAVKILESAGDRSHEVNWLREQAENCLVSDSATRRAFGLNLLRFLYKKGLISIGWFSKRRVRGLLKADPSESVRLAAFDLLGVILTQTGSKSGVRESDYSTILGFRTRMLERSSRLREYENSGVRGDIERLTPNDDMQVTLNRIIAGLD
jgi:hypothetical protein